MSGQLQDPAALLPGKSSGNCSHFMSVSFRVSLDSLDKRKISFPQW